MKQKKESLISNKLTRQIRSFSASKENIQKLLQILQERCWTAADIELEHFEQIDQTDSAYEKDKELLKECFQLKVLVTGNDGQLLYGPISEIFDSPNFPDEPQSIHTDSSNVLRSSYNYPPRNSLKLFLDFNKPQVLNLTLLPSQATLNESNISVTGYESTWVHGVFNEINTFIDKYPSQFTWIHKHSVYDLLVWTIGLPLSFWIVYRLSGILNKLFGNFSVFVQSASYVYVFFATLISFRLLFHYARWVWPLVEYDSVKNKALKHRVAFGVISLSVVSTFIYDLVKSIL